MSFQAMAWASEQTTGSASRKAVLYALANHANKQGCCYLHVETIMDEAELGNTATRTALKDLESQGLVERHRRRREDGTLGVYNFRLPLTKPSPDDKPASESDASPPSPGDAHEPGRPSEPKDLSSGKPTRNVVWDCLVTVMGFDPKTSSAKSDFGKTVRELRAVIPAAAAEQDILKAMRARRAAWDREYPGATFTHHVMRGKWDELGALAGGKSMTPEATPDRMTPEAFRAWRANAPRDVIAEYQHHYDVDDSGEPLEDGGF